MAAHRPPAFRGRAGERELLDRLLENVRGGQSAVLVIRGEAGVGKTALLQLLRAAGLRLPGRADRRRRVRDGAAVRGAASALRADARRGSTRCPSRSRPRCASRSASPPATPPDRFLVALAALSLLAEVARGAAAAVLRRRRAVARRRLGPGPRLRRAAAAGGVGGDRVRRARPEPTSASWPACRSCALDGLDDEDARALLATVIPGRLDERVRDRIVAETRGNPLALLELPRGLSPAQLAGGFGLPDADCRCRAGSRRASCGGSRSCRDETRLLLLVAAAEPVGDPALMWRAATRLGVAGTALEPAARAGLLDVGAQVRFRHPLVRSAVYRSASGRRAPDARTGRWRR